MLKKSIKLGRHETSISIEPEFWQELQNIANRSELSINQLVTQIDNEKSTENLSSAIRVYVLNNVKQDFSIPLSLQSK